VGRIIENNIPIQFLEVGEAELIQRLHPNGWSLEILQYGYLDPTEDLQELQREDCETLSRLGLTHDTIAVAIEKLFATDERSVNGNRLVRVQNIHSPVCPWGDFCSVHPFDLSMKTTEIIVCNKETCPENIVSHLVANSGTHCNDYAELVARDWAMIVSDLHPHLIRDHQFFEGKKTPYRVDPERAMRYLGL
jgi:hypothetical protein